MDRPRIYHNPRCSKSRAALELLLDRDPEIVDYLSSPPTADELRDLLQALGVGPREILRTGEEAYRRLGLDDPGLTDEELVAAMVAEPILIERPIVRQGDRAVVGRPPERVLDLLG